MAKVVSRLILARNFLCNSGKPPYKPVPGTLVVPFPSLWGKLLALLLVVFRVTYLNRASLHAFVRCYDEIVCTT